MDSTCSIGANDGEASLSASCRCLVRAKGERIAGRIDRELDGSVRSPPAFFFARLQTIRWFRSAHINPRELPNVVNDGEQAVIACSPNFQSQQDDFRILPLLFVENLDRYLAPDEGMFGKIDQAHPTFAYQRCDLIVPNLLADHNPSITNWSK